MQRRKRQRLSAICGDGGRAPGNRRVSSQKTLRYGYSYAADAGRGSDTFNALAGPARWRAALLGTVAVGALWVVAPRSAKAGPDTCTVAANIATCTGDQSDGIASGTDFPVPAVDTLNVNTLTQNIAPAEDVHGINFTSSGAVTINSNTLPFGIQTTGDDADGIHASSTGGLAVSVTHTGDIAAGDDGIYARSSILPPGTTGSTGAVTITSTGDITSGGRGINAESTADDGDSGAVTVTSTGDITSTDDIHYGIIANSFSNNGQSGDASVTSTGNVESGGIGIRASSGSYGTGAGAGSASVTSTGDVTSRYSTGIVAETRSRYGDTGDVTVTSTGNIAANYSGIVGLALTVYGDAGSVTVTSEGDIAANGYAGIFARSVRYRYDDNNYDPYDSGAVTVTSTGNITADNQGIFAQSISQWGYAGAVTVNSTGDITAGGPGIRAESSGTYGDGTAAVTVTSDGTVTSTGGDGIFARAHANGASGEVKVYSTGNVTAAGRGIHAVSISGYSGAGPVTVESTGDIEAGGAGIYALSEGRYAAGTVTVTNTGGIQSVGRGISAQSTTEYGSAGAVTVTSEGNITSSSDRGIYAGTFSQYDVAGQVTVNSTGAIQAQGAGIYARSSSAYGSSGAVTVTNDGAILSADRGISTHSGSLFGDSGAVTVNSTGDITAGTIGIYAASFAANGTPGAIGVTVTDGTVRGGSGAGVAFAGGAANTLTIGAPATVRSLSGLAIEGGSGNETVNNSGLVIGNVALGGGTNVFNNLAGGRFNMGASADLGGGNLANSGILSPGGASTVQTSAVGGSLSQGAGGVFAVDVNLLSGQSDRIEVTGTANLNGQVLPSLIGFQTGTQTFTILTADGGITNAGIAVQDTPVVNYELDFPDAQTMNLVVEVDFAPTGLGLTPNQLAVATNLSNASNAGAGALSGLLDYLAFIGDIDAFGAALDRLHPEPYLAQVHASLFASLDFTSSLMSCPAPASPTANAFIAQGQCVWLRTGGRFLETDRTRANIGFEDKAWNISAGVQGAVAPNWFASAALGYDRSNLSVDNRASAEGDIFHAGAALKYVAGNTEISAAVTGGLASYETTRSALMPGVNAKADAEMSFLAGRLRAAYVFGTDTAYMKPLVDFDVIGIRRDGIRESGAGPIGLNVKSQSDTFFSVAPAVEFGSQIAYAGGVMRPFLRLGARFFSEEDLSATAVFIGSPAGVSAFTVTTPLDQWVGELAAGLEMLGTDRYDMRVSYEGRLSERGQQHGGSVKFRARF